jgi:hypothetical protein
VKSVLSVIRRILSSYRRFDLLGSARSDFPQAPPGQHVSFTVMSVRCPGLVAEKRVQLPVEGVATVSIIV